MKVIQATGKNVEKAIEEGLKQLGVSQDEVDIKILDEGGFFRKAKVELTLEKDVDEKPAKKENVKTEKQPAEKKENKKETTEENNIVVEEVVFDTDEPKTPVEEDEDKAIEIGKKFLEEFITKFKTEATVEPVKAENGITLCISGEQVNELIGRRGETLNAIQEILNLVLKNNGFRHTHIFIDIENYKNRREESLISLANRMAHKAVKINKPIKLEAMSAYERKIIHTTLQSDDLVTTKSEGEEPNRYLVIIPTKKQN